MSSGQDRFKEKVSPMMGYKNRAKKRNKTRGASKSEQMINDETVSTNTVYPDSSNRSGTPSVRNDISWHASNPAWLNAVARIPLNPILGDRIPYGEAGGALANNTALPGICTFLFTPTYGLTFGETSPLNQAMVSLFAYIRSRINRGNHYERTDLMKYLLMIDSISMFYSYVARAYRTISAKNLYNKYLGQALVESMGLDYKNLVTWKSILFDLLQRIRKECAELYMPEALNIYKRHTWMIDHIWGDEPSDYAQLYMFVPRTFYRWKDVYEEPDRPGLAPLSIPWIDQGAPLGTVTDLVDMWEQLSKPIMHNTTIGFMAGDIKQAYQGQNLHILPEVPENDDYYPEYSEMALDMIHNLTMIGDFDLDPNRTVIFEALDVPRTLGWLSTDFRFLHPYHDVFRNHIPPDVNVGSAGFMVNQLFDGDAKISNAEVVMEASRCTNIPTGCVAGVWQFSSIAMEVVNYARIHYFGGANIADRTMLTSTPAPDDLIIDSNFLTHYVSERIFTSMIDLKYIDLDMPSAQKTYLTMHWDAGDHRYRTSVGTYLLNLDNTIHINRANGPSAQERVLNTLVHMIGNFAHFPGVAWTSATLYVSGSNWTVETAPFTGFAKTLDYNASMDAAQLYRLNTVDAYSEFDGSYINL